MHAGLQCTPPTPLARIEDEPDRSNNPACEQGTLIMRYVENILDAVRHDLTDSMLRGFRYKATTMASTLGGA
jgi:hypothetical protein